jgi:hypothetical protein
MKAELQRWFDILSSNPVLIRDEEIMLFVESDFGVSFDLGIIPRVQFANHSKVLACTRPWRSNNWSSKEGKETVRTTSG